MKIVRFFASLVPRYGLFFLPWIVVFAVPQLREVARLQSGLSSIVSGPFGNFGGLSPREQGWNDELLEDLPDHVKQQFDFKIWKARAQVYNDYWEQGDLAWAGQEVAKLYKTHPEKKWLPVFNLTLARAGQWSRGYKSATIDKNLAMVPIVRAAEPQNAGPLVYAARWRLTQLEVGLRREQGTWTASAQGREQAAIEALLKQASLKPYYNERQFEVAACILRAQQSLRTLALEERVLITSLDWPRFQLGWEWVNQRIQHYHAQGRRREAVALSLTLARLGALQSQGQNSRTLREEGRQMLAFSLKVVKPPTTKNFQKYAMAQGMPEAAASMGRLQTEALALSQWDKAGHGLQAMLHSNGNPWSAAFGRELGRWILWQVALLLPCWCLLSALFVFKHPAPSSRKDRVAVAGACLLQCAVGALFIWYMVVLVDRTTLPILKKMEMTGLGGTWVFVSPVLLSWLLVSGLTWRRNRPLFTMEPRLLHMLELSASQSALLRRAGTLVAVAILAAWLMGLLVWLPFYFLGWNAAPFTSLLVPFPGNNVWRELLSPNNAVLVWYATFLAAAGLCVWILKWYLATAARAIPVTHSALRWWKESLGIYLLMLAWGYLLVNVAYQPARRADERRLERVLQVGELPALYHAPLAPKTPAGKL